MFSAVYMAPVGYGGSMPGEGKRDRRRVSLRSVAVAFSVACIALFVLITPPGSRGVFIVAGVLVVAVVAALAK